MIVYFGRELERDTLVLAKTDFYFYQPGAAENFYILNLNLY